MAFKLRVLPNKSVMDEKKSSHTPGTCADCGNDAYIRLSGDNGSAEMLCAHCFVDRVRAGKLQATRAPTPRRRDIQPQRPSY